MTTCDDTNDRCLKAVDAKCIVTILLWPQPIQLSWTLVSRPTLDVVLTCMVLGEVGRYPIETEAKCRMLGFWYGLCSTSHSESPKISNLMFQLCSKLYYASDYKLPWLMKVHSLLDSLGLSYIWSYQIHIIESSKRIVKQRLMDQFIQEWQSRVAEKKCL